MKWLQKTVNLLTKQGKREHVMRDVLNKILANSPEGLSGVRNLIETMGPERTHYPVKALAHLLPLVAYDRGFTRQVKRAPSVNAVISAYRVAGIALPGEMTRVVAHNYEGGK